MINPPIYCRSSETFPMKYEKPTVTKTRKEKVKGNRFQNTFDMSLKLSTHNFVMCYP